MELAKIINCGEDIAIAPQVIYSKEMSLHLCKHIANKCSLKIYIYI